MWGFRTPKVEMSWAVWCSRLAKTRLVWFSGIPTYCWWVGRTSNDALVQTLKNPIFFSNTKFFNLSTFHFGTMTDSAEVSKNSAERNSVSATQFSPHTQNMCTLLYYNFETRKLTLVQWTDFILSHFYRHTRMCVCVHMYLVLQLYHV